MRTVILSPGCDKEWGCQGEKHSVFHAALSSPVPAMKSSLAACSQTAFTSYFVSPSNIAGGHQTEQFLISSLLAGFNHATSRSKSRMGP